MVFRPMFPVMIVALCINALCMHAREQEKLVSPAHNLDYQLRHFLYENQKHPKLLEAVKRDRSSYIASLQAHVQSLREKQKDVDAIIHSKIAKAGFYSLFAAVNGVIAAYSYNKMYYGTLTGCINDQIIRAGTDEKNESNKNSAGAQLCFGASLAMSIYGMARAARSLYSLYNYQEIIAQKIARDEQLIALLMQE